jgi:hypothetical protein
MLNFMNFRLLFCMIPLLMIVHEANASDTLYCGTIKTENPEHSLRLSYKDSDDKSSRRIYLLFCDRFRSCFSEIGISSDKFVRAYFNSPFQIVIELKDRDNVRSVMKVNPATGRGEGFSSVYLDHHSDSPNLEAGHTLSFDKSRCKPLPPPIETTPLPDRN